MNADILLYNGAIERPRDQELIAKCIKRRRRENAIFMLVTEGGDADAAYRIARCLQRKYKKFSLYVCGYCKSAGTLIALGAHELIMSDHGELGPLDVQVSKKDELWETQSGLTVMSALTALHDKSFLGFEKLFIDIKARSGGTITLKTATDIAANLTTGMMAPLYSQVDPMHVGEAGRAMSIADHYGRRLVKDSENMVPEWLDFLVSNYPSHGFVIDRSEASVLFQKVREPNQMEILLAELIGDAARRPSPFGAEMKIEFLSSELPAENEAHEPGEREGRDNDEPTRRATRPTLNQTAAEPREKLSESNNSRGTEKVARIIRE